MQEEELSAAETLILTDGRQIEINTWPQGRRDGQRGEERDRGINRRRD